MMVETLVDQSQAEAAHLQSIEAMNNRCVVKSDQR